MALVKTLAHYLAGRPSQPLASVERLATFTLFLIVAFSFNILPPNFSYDGRLASGADGTPFNQIFWVAALLCSLYCLVNMPARARAAFLPALPLCALCVLLLVSALWSLAPLITVRRAGLEMIVVACVVINVMALQRAEQAFHILYRVAALTLAFDLCMLLRANGYDEAGLFRGIHTHKNVTGYLGATSILTGLWLRRAGAGLGRGANMAFLAGWALVLGMSQSKTSIALTLAAPLLAYGLRRLAQASGAGLGMLLAGLGGLAYSAAALAYLSGVDLPGGVERFVHHVGFTGRDDIWDFLLARATERPWLGYGYGGFWDIGPDSPSVRWGSGFLPMINQAHNGYLDLFLALGVVGVAAWAGVLIGYVVCLARIEAAASMPWLSGLCWTLVVFSLLHNLTESSLLRGFVWVWLLQL
ncbi:MAG: O-antigen ligase family protein, partial [Rhodocyclaceae bacterium]|nr:O-antigen ligase family protein [Rhodocyclaceae bacterium]